MTPKELISDLIKEHNIAVEKLTREQFVEAIKQAIQCGDFTRLVRADDNAQQVIYIPFKREQELLNKIEELEEALKGKE